MTSVTLATSFPATVQPGIPKLGNLPEGWVRAPLGRFLHEVRRPAKMQDDQSYRLVTVKRARGGVVDRGEFLGRDVLVKSQFLIEPGDFLISKRQIVHGACGLVPEEQGGAIVSNEYSVLNGNSEIDLSFLNYLAHSVFFQQTCFHSSIGVHIEKMIFKLDRWLKFEFDLPPLAEQKKIAEILTTWDRAIEVAKAQLDSARTQKRALMQQLLTGRRRFPEFEGREAEKMAFPEGWQSVRLAEMCDLINGRGFKPHEWSTSGYPIIRIQNLNGSPDFNHYDGEFNPKILVRDGELLFAWSGSRGTSFGPHIWRGPEAVLNYHTWRVVPKPITSREFLLHYLRHVTAEIEATAHGASALVHTQKDTMESRRCFIPPFGEQQKIAAILSDCDREVAVANSNVVKLRTEKKALMQQLLTGKRRVSV